MRHAVSVKLSEDRKDALERIVRAPTSAQRAVKRARAVLYAAKGWETQRIAKKLKMGINGVAVWRARFVAEGVSTLEHDRPGGAGSRRSTPRRSPRS